MSYHTLTSVVFPLGADCLAKNPQKVTNDCVMCERGMKMKVAILRNIITTHTWCPWQY